MNYLKLNKSYLKNMSNLKTLLVLYYLFVKEDKEGCINFSIKDLIQYWGYVQKRNDNKINQILKEILEELKNSNAIITDVDFNNISISQSIHTSFSVDNNIPWYFKENKSFVTLSIKEMNILKQHLSSLKEKIQIEKILFLYLLLKSYMNFSPQNIAYCFPTFDALVKITGFSRSTIFKYITILKNCNMIFTYDLGCFINTNNKIKSVPMIYALNSIDENVLKNNISASLENFKEWQPLV